LDRDHLVLKPAFGRVGEDVAIRGLTGQSEHKEIMRAVRRKESLWVAQYGRAGRNALIDQNAQDIAVLIRRETTGRIQSLENISSFSVL